MIWNCKVQDTNDVVVAGVLSDGAIIALCGDCLAEVIGNGMVWPETGETVTLMGTHELSDAAQLEI